MNKYLLFILVATGIIFTSCKQAEKSATEEAVVEAPQKLEHKNISTAEFESGMFKENGVILDVRSPEEIAEGHIKGAQFSDFYDDDFESKIGTYPKDKSYYIYCKSGGRSGQASELFSAAGYKNVYNLEGGFDQWISEGKEFVVPN